MSFFTDLNSLLSSFLNTTCVTPVTPPPCILSIKANACDGFLHTTANALGGLGIGGCNSGNQVNINNINANGTLNNVGNHLTSGSGYIYSTSNTWEMHGDPTVNSSFVIDKTSFSNTSCDGKTVTSGLHSIYIDDFYGANENTPGLGLGHQDYLALTGFSSAATISQTAVKTDGSGGAYLDFSIADQGKTYDLLIHTMNGGKLVYNFDYYH